MKILLTGGLGFIGTYIIKELQKHNHKITLLIHTTKNIYTDIPTLKADITQPETLRLPQNFDALIHNAALATDHAPYQDLYATNTKGTQNILEACKKAHITNIILTSTAGVYGFPNTTTPITEDGAKNPYSPYQKTKYLGEQQAYQYKDCSIKIIRPPLVIGPQGKPIQVIMNKLLNNTMTYVGSGTTTLPLVHPADVASLINLCLTKDAQQPEAYNAVSLHTTPQQLFESLCSHYNLKFPQKHVPYAFAYLAALAQETLTKHPTLTRFQVKSLGTNRKLSYQKANKQLNYTPHYDSLQKLTEDIKENYQQTKAT